jgi:hypothetical protein
MWLCSGWIGLGPDSTSSDRDLRELLLVIAVLFPETLDPTFGIDDLLHPGKERVAIGADFHTDIFCRRSSPEDAPARTGDQGFLVGGMDISFHRLTLRSV